MNARIILRWDIKQPTQVLELPVISRGDTLELVADLYDAGTKLFLEPGYAMVFSAKEVGKFSGPALVQTAIFTYDAESKFYVGVLNCETDELNAAMKLGTAEEVRNLEVVGELTFTPVGGGPCTSPDIKVTFRLDVHRGTEGSPISTADPNDYYTKAQGDARYIHASPEDAWEFLRALGWDYDGAKGGFTLVLPDGSPGFIPATVVPAP